MKKSVRIRKAGPNETPGYYNKTAKFLSKVLPKAQTGMQVGNGLQDKLKTIMLDTYTEVRDGNDPQLVFRKLLMDYGMPQEMAYQIMQTVMAKLAQDGYANPSNLQQEDEWDDDGAPAEKSQGTPTAAPAAQNQNPGTPDEDEELALSMSEEDTGYDAMEHYNNRNVEQEEEESAFRRGGSSRRKLKRAQEGMQQPSEEEMMMMQQGQGQPQQQGGGDQMQQMMQQVGQALEQGSKPEEIIAQLLQGQVPPEVIMQIFSEFGMAQDQIAQAIQSVMQQLQGSEEQPMSQEEMMQYGGFYDEGGESPEEDVLDQYSNPGQLSMEQLAPMSIEEMLRSFNLPNNTTKTPDLNAYLQGIYNYQNVGSNDIPNDMLPTSKHGGAHINLPLAARGKEKKEREVTPPEPTPVERVEPTVTIEPQMTTGSQPNILQGLQNAYFKKNALAPQRNAFGTAAQILGTGINFVRPQNWRQTWREGVEPTTTATKTYQDVYNILMDKEYKPETLIPNEDGTFSSGLAFNMGPDLYKMLSKDLLTSQSVKTGLKNNGVVQLEFPTSSVPELNFLSLHNEKSNTKVRLVQGADGALKVELVTDVKTPLKGVDNNTLTIKDEFFFDPNTGSLIDPKTGMPLEMIQKSYYKGNELNWYNQSGTLPFTKKYGSGFDFTGYPEVVSGEALKQKPGSRLNALWNTAGIGTLFTPYALPFTYPGFAARNKFYPNASKVTVDYFGRARELGPQTSGGMTFGDQPFGTQYADYNLQANRNYLTGRNFMIGAGLLGAGLGGGYLYYNRDTKDWDVGTEGAPRQNFQNYIDTSYSGAGRSFDTLGFGIKLPFSGTTRFDKDSMYVSPTGDTIHDKGWGAPAEDYKKGGAHKKKFLKRVQQMFEPGGENQDPSLGKGNRMDNLNSEVSKKKAGFIDKLKKESDKAAREDLYTLVQKSGDPKLMNIFMGDEQEPQDNQMMQQPQFTQEGGYVNMDVDNPLTRFIYGGNEPDYYEQDNLLEARDGFAVPPIMKYNEWFKDYTSQDNWPGAFAGNEPGDNTLSTDPNEATAYHQWMQEFNNPSPEAEEKRFDAYQSYLNFRNEDEEDEDQPAGYMPPVSGSPNKATTHNCPPGSVWIEAYGQCVPIMKTKYNPRIVAGDPGLHNILLPWNPIFKTRGYQMKYGDKLTLKDLKKYAGKSLGDPYATLTYRKHLLSPKRQLDIWNPDGKLSEADMKALMDYGVGKGYKQKGSKNKTNTSTKKEEKTKRENKKEGPREVKFSSAAMKYRLGQGLDNVFGDAARFYGNIGKKIVKPFIKKK